MKKHKGSTRIVFNFRHFVVKFPRVYWRKGLAELRKVMICKFDELKKSGFKQYIVNRKQAKLTRREREKVWIANRSEVLHIHIIESRPYEISESLSAHFFAGLMANWNEFTFFHTSERNPLLMPTYFSLFGLFNIEAAGEELDWDDNQLWNFLAANCEHEDQLWCDGHTFRSKANFRLYRGKLRLVDYGSRHLRVFVGLYGKNIENSFQEYLKKASIQ